MAEEIVIRGETSKARARRLATGWFDKYCPADKSGIDIGCQNDPVHESFRKWDYIFGDGDATFMQGVDDESYFSTYCSHVLEHIQDPVTAIQHWYRITQIGGCLTILVPHADLYEGSRKKPSIWNHDHKWFFLPDENDEPDVLSFRETIYAAIFPPDILSFQVLKDGWYPPAAGQHPPGEYSIEAVIKRHAFIDAPF